MTEDLQQVIQMLLRENQIVSFGPLYQALATGKPIASSDYLNKLNPFLEEQNLMQLGERLRRCEWLEAARKV